MRNSVERNAAIVCKVQFNERKTHTHMHASKAKVYEWKCRRSDDDYADDDYNGNGDGDGGKDKNIPIPRLKYIPRECEYAKFMLNTPGYNAEKTITSKPPGSIFRIMCANLALFLSIDKIFRKLWSILFIFCYSPRSPEMA